MLPPGHPTTTDLFIATQIHPPLRPSEPKSLAAVLLCLRDVNHWLAQNILSLNQSKSELILFSLPKPISVTESGLCPGLLMKAAAKKLGVLFDSDLSFEPQIKKKLPSPASFKDEPSPELNRSHTHLENVIHALNSLDLTPVTPSCLA